MKLKKNPLLWNYCANLNQTLLKWSLGGGQCRPYPELLKIEMSSNGQNCSILSQKVPKFELYKLYQILREWWTFAYFDHYANYEISSPLKIQSLLKWWVIPFQNFVRQCRPLTMAAITKNRNFLAKTAQPESAQIWTV